VRTSWATVDAVGDQSEYVTVISTALSASVPRVGGIISHNYFRFFCEKLVTAVVPKVYQSVLRCRRFSEAGAQQLLLDVVAMKQVCPSSSSMDLTCPVREHTVKQQRCGDVGF
jgi:hypothetical protein